MNAVRERLCPQLLLLALELPHDDAQLAERQRLLLALFALDAWHPCDDVLLAFVARFLLVHVLT